MLKVQPFTSKLTTSLITLTIILTACNLSAKIKIACVGDSITFGARVENRVKNCYPSQLGSMLGDDYEVRNFGVSGSTMLQKGNKPYMKTPAYKASLKFQPDIVIIKLGTNDSKPDNWKHKSSFAESTNALISSYQKLTRNKTRIILCKPVPVIADGNFVITEKIVRGEVSKQIEQIALSQKLELIDLHIPLCDKPELIPDKVHPNAAGAKLMAEHLYRCLSIPRDSSLTLKISLAESSKGFHGHRMLESANGKHKVVSPVLAAKGAPWIWRARFWGHQPQLDIQMLELGYHIVYCDVPDLFGSPKAVALWDSFYKQTQKWRLNDKPVLEGMSRGGLIIHNWAVANPDKVSGIIGDNCVMDIKSWPAGFGTGIGAPRTWKKCKAAYGFKTDEEAKTYPQNSIDTINVIKKANIPLLYIIGTADKVVPPAENSALAAEKLKDYPHLNVITKEGAGHHPHSFPNPAPITEFALKCTGFSLEPSSTK